MKKTTVFSLMLSACCCAGLSAQEANHFVVKANKLGAEIQPTMYVFLIRGMHISVPDWKTKAFLVSV